MDIISLALAKAYANKVANNSDTEKEIIIIPIDAESEDYRSILKSVVDEDNNIIKPTFMYVDSDIVPLLGVLKKSNGLQYRFGSTYLEINGEKTNCLVNEFYITVPDDDTEELIWDGNGMEIRNGTDGKDGHTPVKGEDYFTEEDKQELINLVLAALPNSEEVNY